MANKNSLSNSNSKSKIITVTSGKGGVGKSTFSANIGYLLTQRGYKVLIIDADIGLANMQVLLNLKPEKTISDYVNAQEDLENIILQTQYTNLFLIAGNSGYQYANSSSTFVYSRVVKQAAQLNEFDFIIVDTGAGLNDFVKEFLEISTNIFAVTTTDPSAITDLYALIKMLSKDKKSLMLCFNHTKNHKIGETVTNSLDKLVQKNRLNNDFVLKYLGNVQSSQTISTTSRLRKLFACEFLNDDVTNELQKVVDGLIENVDF